MRGEIVVVESVRPEDPKTSLRSKSIVVVTPTASSPESFSFILGELMGSPPGRIPLLTVNCPPLLALNSLKFLETTESLFNALLSATR